MPAPLLQPPVPTPSLAIIANAMTPYRLALHERIASEIQELRLISIFTHEVSNAPWALTASPAISPISFGAGESAADSTKVSRFPAEFAKGGQIIKYLQSQNVQAVVVLGYNDPGRLRIMRWAHKHDLPSFLFGDSNARGDTATGLRALAKRIFVKRVVSWNQAILPCGTLGQAFFERYGADPAKIFFFPYEPDYALIEKITPDQIAQSLQKFNLDPHRKRIVFSGRLLPVKRPDLLLQAFATIAPERPEWDLLMIGDGALRASLYQTLAQTPSLANRVFWTGFLNDQQQIAALYRASDILVLPSDFEPWALVINEAAAAGLAIIATDVVGAAAELVRDNINGRLFPPGNLQALTQSLLWLTQEPALSIAKSASAQVLADWRRRGDPVQGLRNALASARVLPLSSSTPS